jgi:hypothetical protein
MEMILSLCLHDKPQMLGQIWRGIDKETLKEQIITQILHPQFLVVIHREKVVLHSNIHKIL